MTVRKSVEASLTAANTFTDYMQVDAGDRASISISGTWAGTITLQRLLTATAPVDVPNAAGTIGWTANVEETYLADEGCEFRIGFKAAEFTSGTAVLRLGKG